MSIHLQADSCQDTLHCIGRQHTTFSREVVCLFIWLLYWFLAPGREKIPDATKIIIVTCYLHILQQTV